MAVDLGRWVLTKGPRPPHANSPTLRTGSSWRGLASGTDCPPHRDEESVRSVGERELFACGGHGPWVSTSHPRSTATSSRWGGQSVPLASPRLKSSHLFLHRAYKSQKVLSSKCRRAMCVHQVKFIDSESHLLTPAEPTVPTYGLMSPQHRSLCLTSVLTLTLSTRYPTVTLMYMKKVTVDQDNQCVRN